MIDNALNRPAVLSDYLAAPDRLAQVVAGLDAAALDRSLTADTWTIRQLVHHIVDGDDLWSMGIKAAIGNPDGVFTLQWYWDVPQTTWAAKWHYADRDVQPALELFGANRRHLVQLLEVVPDAWDRAITISVRGREDECATVAEIVEMQARHALGHITEIEAILATGLGPRRTGGATASPSHNDPAWDGYRKYICCALRRPLTSPAIISTRRPCSSPGRRPGGPAVKQVNVGIIGTGWCGGIRAETCAANPFVANIHIAENRPERLAEVARACNARTATADWRDLLKIDEIDLFYISATPETLHYPMARECLLFCQAA